MTNLWTIRWGIGALVVCAGLVALQSGMAQVTTEREEASGPALTGEELERESRRERKREEMSERGGYGRGGYGGGRGGGYGGEGRGYGEMGAYGGRYGGYGRPTVDLNRIKEAAKALVEAKDDDARENAERNLDEQLDAYFEEDMQRREEELAKVERRVKELRELLERRREKKDDIIRLQVEVLRNEADGLGFFSAEGAGGPQSAFSVLWQAGPGAGLPQGHPPVQAVPAAPTAPGVPPTPVVAPVAVPVKR